MTSLFRRSSKAVYKTFGEGRRWRVLDGVPRLLETLAARASVWLP